MTPREISLKCAEMCEFMAQDWLERCKEGSESRAYEDAALLDAARAIRAFAATLPEDKVWVPREPDYRAMLLELCEAAEINLEFTRYSGIWKKARAMLAAVPASKEGEGNG